MFSVDYATLRQVMRQFGYTGVFRATVTNGRFFLGEGQIELQVKEGVAVSCRFVTKQGEVYNVDRWEVQIGLLGVLNWELTALQTEAPTQRAPSSGPLPIVSQSSTTGSQPVLTPHHATTLFPAQLRQLPMLYRQVYSLIDGRRQPSDIAQLLYKPTQEITRVIDDLRRQKLIEFK